MNPTSFPAEIRVWMRVQAWGREKESQTEFPVPDNTTIQNKSIKDKNPILTRVASGSECSLRNPLHQQNILYGKYYLIFIVNITLLQSQWVGLLQVSIANSLGCPGWIPGAASWDYKGWFKSPGREWVQNASRLLLIYHWEACAGPTSQNMIQSPLNLLSLFHVFAGISQLPTKYSLDPDGIYLSVINNIKHILWYLRWN